MELEFATTQELIQELLSRTTFAGILISSCKEIKKENMALDEWEVFSKNLYPSQARELLIFMADRLQEIEDQM